MRSILLLLQLILFVGTAVLLHEAGDPVSNTGRPPASASRTPKTLPPPRATVVTPHVAADIPAHSTPRAGD